MKLAQNQRRLKICHTVIISKFHLLVVPSCIRGMYHFLLISGNSVGTQPQQMMIQLLVICGNSTALPTGYCFDRMEAETGHICQTAHRLSFVFSTDGMCRILYEYKMIFLTNLLNFIMLHCLSCEIHRNNPLCFRRN